MPQQAQQSLLPIPIPDFAGDLDVISRFHSIPTPPSEPPTLQDVIAAIRLAHAVAICDRTEALNGQSLMKAQDFKDRVMSRFRGGNTVIQAQIADDISALQREVLDGFQALQTDFQALRTDFQTLRTDFQTLWTDFRQQERATALLHNHSAGTAPNSLLMAVPSPGGIRPSEHEPPLPPLNTPQAIKDLPRHLVTSYHHFYFPNPDRCRLPIETCRKQLFRAVGAVPL